MAARHHNPGELDAHVDTFTQALVDRLEGPDARLRAELLAAQILGLAVRKGILHTRTLAAVGPEAVVRLLGPAMQHCLDPSRGRRCP